MMMDMQHRDESYLGNTGQPIEVGGEGWIAQTIFWSRAVAGISLLVGGGILLLADWNASGVPAELLVGLVWGGPAAIYFFMSFFVRRFGGNGCRVIGLLAAGHAVAILVAAVWAGFQRSVEVREMLALAGVALAAGVGNLAVSAFWARRWIIQPTFYVSGKRG